MAEKTIFVNLEKKERAEIIVGLLTGKIFPKNPDEVERIAHYSRIASEGKVDLKSPSAITFFYEKLGGLLRTEEEEKVAKEKKVEAQKKGKKDSMGLRK